MPEGKQTQSLKLLGIAASLGGVIAFAYLIFEWIVTDGSNWLWNDLLQSDVYRWRVIPIAIVMSVVLSLLYKGVKQKRVVHAETDLLSEISNSKSTSLSSILTIFTIGAVSLLAGASLGPEASLLAGVLGIAAWTSGKAKLLNTPIAKLLALSSVGALLCAFMCSPIPMAIPLLLMQKSKKLTLQSALPVLFMGTVSWIIVYLLKGEPFGQVPVSETFTAIDIVIAAGLGFAAVLIGVALKWVIKLASLKTSWIAAHTHWLVSAVIFGTVLGILYLLGGQSIQFSGSEGSQLLASDKAMYSAIALLSLVVLKLLATAWSLSSGYRGGLVFPSVYMGLAFSYSIAAAFMLVGADSAGATVGAISGIFVAMLSPVVGVVLLLSLFPQSLTLLVIAGAIGAVAGSKAFAKLLPPQAKETAKA